MVEWKSSSISWGSSTLKEGLLFDSSQVSCRTLRAPHWNQRISGFLYMFLLWCNAACVRGLPFLSTFCSVRTLSIFSFTEAFKYGFTCWMAPRKFPGFIYAIVWVTLAYGSAVKGKEWASLAHLPVTQPAALDFCPQTGSILARLSPFLSCQWAYFIRAVWQLFLLFLSTSFF